MYRMIYIEVVLILFMNLSYCGYRMRRNKRNARKRGAYTKEEMQLALNAIYNENSIRHVSSEANIPYIDFGKKQKELILKEI